MHSCSIDGESAHLDPPLLLRALGLAHAQLARAKLGDLPREALFVAPLALGLGEPLGLAPRALILDLNKATRGMQHVSVGCNMQHTAWDRVLGLACCSSDCAKKT
jgi:hypothetical protein